jgi:hypothetical protein
MNLRLSVLLLISLGFPCVGTACSCTSAPPDQEDVKFQEILRNSDLVFRGKIVAHRDGVAVFRVYEYWKGNIKSNAEVEWRRGDRGDCNGFWPDDLKVGNELLVFARKGRFGVYRTDICLATGLASKAQNVLRVLGPGKQVPISAR